MMRTGLIGWTSSSLAPAMGCQYRRSSSPIGVPAPTRVSISLRSAVSKPFLPLRAGCSPPAIITLQASSMEGRCRGFSGELFKRQKDRRGENACYLRVYYVIMQLKLMALDETIIDQFAATIAETLARHR